MLQQISEAVTKIADEMITIRREIHRHPETALQEHQTAALIAQQLSKAGIEVHTGVGKTGVVGIVRGAKRGKCIALRADMDALPIPEKTGLPYASQIPGVMHACGHDCHVAMVLAAGWVLQQHRERLKGCVKLIFQPAEESVCGAPLMIAHGVLERPKLDAIVAVHVWKNPVGTISLRYGEHLAAADRFTITIQGKGGHGATPHLAADPVLAAANVILALQQIVARRLDPVRPAVVSVCRINGGSAFNIIPDEVTVQGTARTFGGSTQDLVEEELKRVAKGAAKTYGCRAKVSYTRSCPALVHNEALTRLTQKVCEELLGEKKVIIEREPCMGAEDFAFFAAHVPATQVAVGIQDPHGPEVVFHSSHFVVDERGLLVGAQALVCVAWRFLNASQERATELIAN
ncbi:MAG: M20 metallopeptidase family protein [Candidatus Zipacnadales bacterium]